MRWTDGWGGSWQLEVNRGLVLTRTSRHLMMTRADAVIISAGDNPDLRLSNRILEWSGLARTKPLCAAAAPRERKRRVKHMLSTGRFSGFWISVPGSSPMNLRSHWTIAQSLCVSLRLCMFRSVIVCIDYSVDALSFLYMSYTASGCRVPSSNRLHVHLSERISGQSREVQTFG